MSSFVEMKILTMIMLAIIRNALKLSPLVFFAMILLTEELSMTIVFQRNEAMAKYTERLIRTTCFEG